MGIEKCETCQANLFTFCARCGTRNGRVLTRCRKCGRRLKEGMRRRSGSKGRGPVNLLYLGIGVLVLILAFTAIIMLTGVRLW